MPEREPTLFEYLDQRFEPLAAREFVERRLGELQRSVHGTVWKAVAVVTSILTAVIGLATGILLAVLGRGS